MARSVKKGPFVDAHLLKKVEAAKNSPKKEVKEEFQEELLQSNMIQTEVQI